MSDSHYCRAVTPQPLGSTPSPTRVAPHGKQGAHNCGANSLILPASVPNLVSPASANSLLLRASDLTWSHQPQPTDWSH
ncbi:hypothetical protein PoB_003191800 [Plakobranchus ocellatus]|uniref:Uncharacterized protein n=1 Tax=Plakobranchus ocellatus TaxID=259542 RepID=A0AAV4AFT8_9GAST|nr:hypothetical protein PoB_003191800 [Plakobranchus ocellatus]